MMTELGLGLQQYFKVPSSLTIDTSVARKRYQNTTEWCHKPFRLSFIWVYGLVQMDSDLMHLITDS